ncbi:hypothetical protein FQA47_009260 [Oryzias melastigma]|uniref:Uncharacterized protein n=1 Tax=Oryzias melastigma TaxID=30732 RepID=A0A834CIQ4_ORYME|nr:hypothetical protein FQA47_009260 [Oryzias melastigma]
MSKKRSKKIKNHADKKKNMVMKLKSVCYFHGVHPWGNLDRKHLNSRYEGVVKMIFKRRRCIHNFSLMKKNNPFESKELPEHESGDVIPIYSGYEVPSFSLPSLLFL